MFHWVSELNALDCSSVIWKNWAEMYYFRSCLHSVMDTLTFHVKNKLSRVL